jgi:ABC-2 type transport system ATP-binding protein
MAMAPSKAIVISTHILEEVDAICTRAVIIARGRVVADGTPESLEALSPRHNGVAIKVAPDSAASLIGVLRQLDSVAEVRHENDGVFVYSKNNRDIFDEVRVAVRQRSSVDVRDIHLERGRLEDVFRSLTTRGVHDRPQPAEVA